jgi:uncharacterized protein (TIGR00269 family)
MATGSTACSICQRDAVYRRMYSGERLCRKCFTASVQRRVQRTITRQKMFAPDDRIGVAYSGGKDSASLLHILAKLEARFPASELLAITIDEGIEGYREEALQLARETCTELGVEHHTYSFKDLYSQSLDAIVEHAKGKTRLSPCSLCGVLRRRALNTAARALHVTKLTTAHNLDDEAQSLVMNVLRGDVHRLTRYGSVHSDGLFIPRVKPLRTVPEREVALYAFLTKIRVQVEPCPYRASSMRSVVRNFLNTMEDQHPGMKFTILRSLERLSGTPETSPIACRLRRCSICDEPTSRDVCRSCQILRELGLTASLNRPSS